MGYKVHLTETCDADKPPLITQAETRPAIEQDNEATWRDCKSVCLSVVDRHNSIPFAYQHTDVIEHLQLPALQAAQDFGWQLLQHIDRGDSR